MRKLPLVAQWRPIEQFSGHIRVEDEVAVEQLDPVERLVSSWHALRYLAITNVGLGWRVIALVRTVMIVLVLLRMLGTMSNVLAGII